MYFLGLDGGRGRLGQKRANDGPQGKPGPSRFVYGLQVEEWFLGFLSVWKVIKARMIFRHL